MPEMTLAHTLYKEIVPAVLQVELKRGEQETPFSSSIGSIRVVYGIPVLVQILTALGEGYAGTEPVFLLFRRVQPPFCLKPSSEGLPPGAGRNGSRSGPRAPRGPTSQKSVWWRWPCMQSSGSPWWRNI